MSDTTFSWKNYWKPTPSKIRQWADALLIAFITISELKPELSSLSWVGLILKLLSNFFKDANTEYIKVKSDPESDTTTISRM